MRLQNLAGKSNADEVITDELYLAGVNKFDKVTKSDSDVPYTIVGRLDCGKVDFTFRRFWYYYVVDGFVPPDIAFLLQKSKYGKQIRPSGDCSPDDYSTYLKWYDASYKEINLPETKAEFEQYANETTYLGKRCIELLNTLEFREPRSKPGDSQFITTYHIDSLTGLKYFVDTVQGK